MRRLTTIISAKNIELMRHIHELAKWPDFFWDNKLLANQLALVRYQQGLLLGRMSAIGFNIRKEASLEILTSDIIKSFAIEGEKLNQEQVRSSLAIHLGINIGGLVPRSRHIDGIVSMMLDATQNHRKPLTKNRLYNWHRLLFPKELSGWHSITAGRWRSSAVGAMQVVSGYIGHERVHFEAPQASKIATEMRRFLNWFNCVDKLDPLLRAGIAHFWFVTIHPFEDGNGRIVRAIADMCLARADSMAERFYSMSASIEKERKAYYAILESSQKGNLDITEWLKWFLTCLSHAIKSSDKILQQVLRKANIWQKLSNRSVNERQRKIIDLLLGNFEGKLTTSKYAKITKCSQDTALRDIEMLINYGVMVKNPGSGRNTSYEVASN